MYQSLALESGLGSTNTLTKKKKSAKSKKEKKKTKCLQFSRFS